MSSGQTTNDDGGSQARPPRRARALGLAIAFEREERHRAGEVALVHAAAEASVLGRGPAQPTDAGPRLRFVRERPIQHGRVSRSRAAWLANDRLSRDQLLVRSDGARLHLERIGRLPLRIGDQVLDGASVAVGGTFTLGEEMVLVVVERELDPEPLAYLDEAAWSFPFGEPDRFGLVGESPGAWALRDRLAFAAPRTLHVLLEGESGAGKEICAQAIHRLSPRAGGVLVSRNAATLPPGLIDAELFGHARNFPQAGMPERGGLIAESDGGTLFLDEIAELPGELQAHLLRVLDEGEYQRLGEATTRRSDFRLLAATNRSRSALKHDLAARLKVSVAVPGLGERLEDVPLLARHLVLRAASGDRDIQRFVRSSGERPEIALEPRLVERLMRHRYTLHVRELESLLWTSIAGSRGDVLVCTDEVDERIVVDEANTSAPSVAPSSLSAEQVREALRGAAGNKAKAFRALGLRSRDQLYRLMKKLGMDEGPD